ncbi:MAG: RES family NAD+ phosphorylase [Bacteroidales bacterium]|nr:RES family NAD+ phosphorylase [Bacteroidales bacterium]
MNLFRITKSLYANLDGFGGLMVSGRWHDKGLRIVYLSENRALAVLEYLVHVGENYLLPADLVLLTLEIPDKIKIARIDPALFPSYWQQKPALTRRLGSDFLKEGKELLLRVPSVIVPGEFNYILNPLHPDAKQCKMTVSPYKIDDRI